MTAPFMCKWCWGPVDWGLVCYSCFLTRLVLIGQPDPLLCLLYEQGLGPHGKA